MDCLISGVWVCDVEAVGWVVVLVLCLTLAVVSLFLHVTSSTKLSSAKAVDKMELPPTFNVGFPVIGNIVAFLKDPIKLVWAGYANRGEVFTVRLGTKNLTFLLVPEANEAFYKASDTQLDPTEVNSFLTPIFGRDVAYDATLEKSIQQLRFLGRPLEVDIVATYVPLMIKEAEDYFVSWGNEGELDLYEELSKLNNLSGARCILRREIRERFFADLFHIIGDLGLGLRQIAIAAHWLPIKAHRDRDRARKQIEKIFEPIRSDRRVGITREDDMLQMLIEAKYRDGSVVKDHEIVGILIAGLFGAHHTAATTSIWLGMRLLPDKSALKRAMAEQKTVLNRANGELKHEALLKMNFLHTCVKEVVRMDVFGQFTLRKVVEELPVLGGRFIIPENHYVGTSSKVSGRLPKVFPNPNKWDPDRFLPPREEDKRKPFSYIGFGGGRHYYLGRGFAFLQVKTIWTTLLNTFDMEAIGEKVPEASYKMLISDVNERPCRIRYKRKVPLPE